MRRFVLILALLLSACGSPAPTDAPRANSGWGGESASDSGYAHPTVASLEPSISSESAPPSASTAYVPPTRTEQSRAGLDEVAPRERPGLATSWGEARQSLIRHVSFVRRDTSNPTITGILHYNDSEGSAVQASRYEGPDGYAVGAVSVALIDEYGSPLPAHHTDHGAYVVAATRSGS
jgi:hypothetical protein